MRTVLLAALLLAASTSVEAITGNDALSWHRGASGKVSVPLLAYVRGAIDGERAIEEVLRDRANNSTAYKAVWNELAPKMFCPPPKADVTQAYDILVRWLEANPEDRQLDLAVHLRVALRRSWQCTP